MEVFRRTCTPSLPRPSLQVRVAVQEAAKLGDISAGLAAYDAATARSIPIIGNVYDILMYLCAGGDDWDTGFRQQLAALPSVPHKTPKGEGSTALRWPGPGGGGGVN